MEASDSVSTRILMMPVSMGGIRSRPTTSICFMERGRRTKSTGRKIHLNRWTNSKVPMKKSLSRFTNWTWKIRAIQLRTRTTRNSFFPVLLMIQGASRGIRVMETT